jgi:glyoxylase-like metal-dependent hydrolase (beta-lactamase superfamily II)
MDSGCSSDLQIIYDFIANDLNLPISSLKLVISTHAHPDHSGGAFYYKKKFSTPIAGPPNINKWYSGFKGFITYILDIFLTYLVSFKMKKKFRNIYFPRHIDFDFSLTDGMVIPGFEDLVILNTPGHTDDDITIFCEKDSWAYIADKIISLRNFYIRPYPISSPVNYKKSLNRLIDLKISKFYLAHHGECTINENQINKLIEGTPKKPRVHRNSLLKILSGMLRASYKRRP